MESQRMTTRNAGTVDHEDPDLPRAPRPEMTQSDTIYVAKPSNRKPFTPHRGYPVQQTSLPDQMSPELAEMLRKDADFEHKRENRVFEDKIAAIECKKQRKMYEYYLLSTGKKLDVRFYHVFATVGSTIGVTVAQGGGLLRPVILGRSPSMIVSHLRVWHGKQDGFADDTMEVFRTLGGGDGLQKAIQKLQSKQQHGTTSAETKSPARKRVRVAKRTTPWRNFEENEIFEGNGDEGSIIMSDEDVAADPGRTPRRKGTPDVRRSSTVKRPRLAAPPVRIFLDERDDTPAPAPAETPTVARGPSLIVTFKLPAARQQPTPPESTANVENPGVDEASDSEGFEEIEDPARKVKPEPSDQTAIATTMLGGSRPVAVVFKNNVDKEVRRRQWHDCDSVEKLFTQAVVAGLSKSTKAIAALNVTLISTTIEVALFKDDAADFGMLEEAIAQAQSTKFEQTDDVLTIVVRSL